ncbi:hypothetical protein Hanom_Chr13g01204211 [Helianthus anomalus]
MSTSDDVVTVEEAGGALTPLKWYQLGCKISQTTADAPPGYITLCSDFFGEGNFRLQATHFLCNILQYYSFHISQLSILGMVRIKHFESVCRSQGEEPKVDKFRVFYQLRSNMGFFSFALHVVKKILINLLKSFHDWKMKFSISAVK